MKGHVLLEMALNRSMWIVVGLPMTIQGNVCRWKNLKNAIQDHVMTGEPTIPTFAVYFSEEAPEKAE